MRCRRQHHNFPLSTLHLQLKSPYPKIGAKSRGTTLIHPTHTMGPLSRSVTGAPVPVFPGDAKVACRTLIKGLPPFPLSLNGQLNLLIFRIVFAYRKYSTTKCGNVNGFPLVYYLCSRENGISVSGSQARTTCLAQLGSLGSFSPGKVTISSSRP